MTLNELLNEGFNGDLRLNDQYPGYWDASADNSQSRLTDLRKTRLTLAQIRKIRQMYDINLAEKHQKMQFLQKMYKYIPKKYL